MAHDGEACHARQYRADPAARARELNRVENIWHHMCAKWLSNRVFDTRGAMIDAACEAWRKLIGQLETITSIGMRKWAHVDQAV